MNRLRVTFNHSFSVSLIKNRVLNKILYFVIFVVGIYKKNKDLLNLYFIKPLWATLVSVMTIKAS